MIGFPMRCIIRRAGSGASGAAPVKKKRTDEKSCFSTSGLIASPRTIGGAMKQTVARRRSTSVQESTISKRGIITCVAPGSIGTVLKRVYAEMLELGRTVRKMMYERNGSSEE